MNDIFIDFRITSEEYAELERQFGKLCYYAAHQLKKKNSRNNYTEEIEDIAQELQFSLIRAGCYYKRQIYVEKCLQAAKTHARDSFLVFILKELENLWDNRTRHGASRQKFGKFQEELLERIVRKIVPKTVRPNKQESLKIDSKFSTYCKAIAWNSQKSMGKKITREKSIRSGQVSLSEFDYLGAAG